MPRSMQFSRAPRRERSAMERSLFPKLIKQSGFETRSAGFRLSSAGNSSDSCGAGGSGRTCIWVAETLSRRIGGGSGCSDMRLKSRTSTLQDLYADESANIRQRFEETGDGKAAIRGRSSLIDSVVIDLWNEVTETGDPIEGF